MEIAPHRPAPSVTGLGTALGISSVTKTSPTPEVCVAVMSELGGVSRVSEVRGGGGVAGRWERNIFGVRRRRDWACPNGEGSA